VLHGKTTIQVLTIRTGNLLGSKAYFPLVPPNSSEAEILAAFLPQYYLLENGERKIPKQIILSHTIEEENWLKTALMERTSYRISFITKPRGQRAKWLLMALQNAKQSLVTHLASRATVYQRLEALQLLLMLDSLPQRLECFDISHSQGEATVASCVVFDIEGPRKSDYRRFNIENVTSGDDYAAMRQALFRRYSAVKTTEAPLPDVLLIDGGKGQLKQAESVLEELQISGVTLLAVAKGPTRKPGMESLLLSGHPVPLQASSDSIALHLIQQIRDEAHRFAITGHRGRRAKARHTSVLEIIPGIGAKRRRELLRQFGGMQELKRASIDELAKVPGVSLQLAERIYFALQAEG
jgi:excinuclease ABC subunit C